MSPFEGPPQRNALDLLQPLGEGESRPFLDQIWGGLVGSVMGFGLFSFSNYMRQRPTLSGHYIIPVRFVNYQLSNVNVFCLFSGIQRHIGGAIALGTLMHYGYEYRRSYFAERDAVYRHYVETHPDDFIYPGIQIVDIPIPICHQHSVFFIVRQRYSEVLLPWVPIR